MAVLDFPASPITGDKYPVTAVPGQPQYTYDGVKWTTIGAQISNAAPATALPLMDAATAVVGTATKYAREDHVHPKIAAAPMDALAYSGLQVNGSMEVSQESGAAGVALANGVFKYIVDGWAGVYSNATAAFTGAQVVIGAQPPVNGYFPKAVQLQATTAISSLASGDYATLFHQIEGYRCARLGWGTANAQPITLSFWVYAPVVGHFSVTIRNAPTYNRSYVVDLTVSAVNTWEYKTVTIPGDTAGTWNKDNTTGMHIAFVFASGSGSVTAGGAWIAGNFFSTSAQTNFFATANTSVFITGVVVLPGIAAPTAAQSPLIMRPYDQELVTCRRYYRNAGGPGFSGQSITATVIALYQSFDVPMRATPALSLFTTSVNAYQPGIGASPGTGCAIGASGITFNGCYIELSGFTGMTVQQPVHATTDPVLKIDARL